MVVHPAAGNPDGTLVNALLHHVKDLSGIGGESAPASFTGSTRARAASWWWPRTTMRTRNWPASSTIARSRRNTLALVWGLVRQRKRIEAAIGRDPKHRHKMSTRASRAREAVTRITWARDFRGVTLCRIAIYTGRTHQIRVHLSAIGHPIVGDALYGGSHRRVPHQFRAVQSLTRPFLHAERLSFTHPRTRERMTFTAPLPPDLEAVARAVAPPELRDAMFAPVPAADEQEEPGFDV